MSNIIDAIRSVIIDKELMPTVCEDSLQAEWTVGESRNLAEAIAAMLNKRNDPEEVWLNNSPERATILDPCTCGGNAWFSRVIPMGYYCEDCGKEIPPDGGE